MDALLIFTLVLGFYAAWNIGANDVSNAMGTSVGSKALTLRQAVCIAAIFEFSGALFFGSHVSETLQKGIVNPEVFVLDPQVLLCGMLASLLATGLWLQLATYFGLPVSTTHTIVGAILGFGAIVGGIHAIEWKNILKIACSWILSPLMGAIISCGIFTLLRKGIFYSSSPLEAAKKWLPWIIFFGTAMLGTLICYEIQRTAFDFTKITLIFSLALATALTAHVLLARFAAPFCPLLPAGTSSSTAGLHTEFFWVEKFFGQLQIASACLMAFSHGANDVSNAIGPLAAAVSIIQTQSIAFSNQFPTWILVLGGCGIIVGLWSWGWRVIETIGKKITELTPSRGFSAEFGAALTILLASGLGLPISTTHTLVGAVLGVGFAGGIGTLNFRILRDIGLSWIVTIPAGAISSIACYYVLFALLVRL